MAFNVISIINLDIARPNADTINAVQYDSSGRVVRANLLNNGTPWAVPYGVYPVIRYQKSDRIGGFYDTDENNSYAINFANDRKTVDLTLALQVLTTPGLVNVQVNFYNTSGIRVTSFAFKVLVERSIIPDTQIVSSEYYNALTETIKVAAQEVNLSEATVRAENAAERATAAAETAETELMQSVPTLVSDWLTSNMTNPSNPAIDKSLTVANAAADAKTVGVNIAKRFPEIFDTADYNTNISGTAFLISDNVIPKDSYLKSFSVYSISTSPHFYFYLIDVATHRVIFVKEVEAKTGWSCHSLAITAPSNCVIGFYGHNFKAIAAYTNNDLINNLNRFSNGYIEGNIKPAKLGDVITYNQYGTNANIAVPLYCTCQYGTNSLDDSPLIDDAKKIRFHRIEPEMMLAQNYTTEISLTSFLISDRILPAGSFISSVHFYDFSDTADQYFYIIDNATLTVLERIRITISDSGYYTIPINYYCKTECRIGVYGHVFRSAVNDVTDGQMFSHGYIEGSPKNAKIGEVISLSTSSAGTKIAIPMQWEYSIVTTDLIYGATEAIKYKYIDDVDVDSGCIACFIDDDTGRYVRDIWDEIISETGIRMGFACVTGYISREVTPTRDQYVPMTISELQELYNNGHEVYSHSYTHPAFYEENLYTIDYQCRLAKMWLDQNGFSRTSDILVYPGGLGFAYNKNEAKRYVKHYYKYGIDASGGACNSINQMKFYPYSISRANADTGTLAELEAEVDRAYLTKSVLIFMNHAYELNKDRTNQINKMIALINYIKNKGIPIIPFGEAMHEKFGW